MHLKGRNATTQLLPPVLIALCLSACQSEPAVVDTTLEESQSNSINSKGESTVSDANSDTYVNANGLTKLELTLVQQYENLNSQCRGGLGSSSKTLEACEKRDDFSFEMSAAGLCFGKAWQSSFEMEWHHCERDSNGLEEVRESSSEQGAEHVPKWTPSQLELIARWENEMKNCDPASDAFAEVETACDRLDLVEQEMLTSGICTEPVPDSDGVVLLRCR